MAKNQKVEIKISILVIILTCLFFFAPFLKNPRILTAKDNDLGRTYIPIIVFTRDSFYSHKQIPLWRLDQLMGESFIGNPISSIFYPANITFLIKDSNYAAIIYLYLHIALAGVSTFFLAKSFKLSDTAATAAAIFYALSFKMLAHLEAGHMTMIAAASFIPPALLTLRNLMAGLNLKWLTIGSMSGAFMFFTYPTIFYYTVIFLIIYWFSHQLTFRLRQHIPLLILGLVTLALSAIALFPQLEFAPLSTRSNLKLEDIAVPLWNIKMFTQSLLFPYKILTDLNHEAFLYLGAVPTLLATLGFLKLRAPQKTILILFGSLALLFAAGTSTPLFSLAYDYVPLLKYSRVTTRFWFIIALITALLSAHAINNFKLKRLTLFLILFFLIESAFIFYRRIDKIPSLNFKSESLYQYLANDKDFFRVYCTTHCLNPQLASKYNIQVLDGENPIQDASFVKFLQKAGNYSWNQFAVIFPPYQVWQVANPPIPDAQVLGQVNVKYVASTYPINNPELVYINNFDGVYLYKNNLSKRRAFFEDDNTQVEISKYSPNKIELIFQPEPVVRKLIVADNYYKDWFAYINYEKHQVLPADNQSRLIIIPPNASEVELKFQPQSFQFGKTITVATLIVLTMWYFKKAKTTYASTWLKRYNNREASTKRKKNSGL